ncbi:histone-like nucleoid-structuring protein Lsr2 [Curtobacterium flaccumfaciens]|uniref:histone-like nucleoid-structuring protein Lsr2 n=1 Tax=Curtobacterium flaccumfaciens TaxID=2035 RepID=UPI0005AC0406|nr:Lsr2 family protein [Curtobacterium flaccumfaciens]KIQ02451.1 lysylphosphatidylglycerol synthetase [Curtobacterium flaccumfaciens]
MAQKITTTLVDDLTDEPIAEGAGETVQFGFDGQSYEIDLTNENAGKLREAFSDYVAAARKVGGRATRPRAASSGRTAPDELAKIREWAAKNGHDVAARGRISQTVRDAYAAAH